MDQDARVAAILAEWRERIDRGEDVSFDDLVSAHPEHAEALREHAVAIDAVEAVLGAVPDAESLRPDQDGRASVDAKLLTMPTDRYVAFRPAGEGGMGIVYWALDTQLNRQVAFKIVRPGHGSDGKTPAAPVDLSPPDDDTPASHAFSTLKTRFLQEAWVTGGLEHPGIVPVYELGQTPEGIPYYTMRFVRGDRTFATAMRSSSGGMEERLKLLEPFLKVCDTIRYAHDRGVIHRDLKPENIALGEFGEAVVLDWGLARLHDDEGEHRWKEHIHEYREARDFETVAGALGTPGYMSPEAAKGDVAAVDERSDVYSLGAILYEILTGRLPFTFSTYGEFLQQVLGEDAAPARDLDPAVPEALSVLCARTLSREPAQRPAGVDDLAGAIRDWQARSAARREIERRLLEVKMSLASAEGLSALDLLRQVDRAGGPLSQVLERDPENEEGLALRARLDVLREQGIREREQGARKRLLRTGGVAALIVATVAGIVVAGVIDQKRLEAERAREAARAERDEKSKALERVYRLADAHTARDLREKAKVLWPLRPELAAPMATWIQRAKELLENRSDHADHLHELESRASPYSEAQRLEDHAESIARLKSLRFERTQVPPGLRSRPSDSPTLAERKREGQRERIADIDRQIRELEGRIRGRGTWSFETKEDAWLHQMLQQLHFDLWEIEDKGLLAEIQDRHDLVGRIGRALEDLRGEWGAVVAAIEAAPHYRGLKITPQVGLIPLGPDPGSGLFEFAHVGSGTIPRRDPETRRLTLEDDFAVVLVLIPGGTFHMGAQSEDSEKPNYDPQAKDDEKAVHEVTLSPFFLSKYECTQAQWVCFTRGRNPSYFRAGAVTGAGGESVGETVITPRNPVERVAWDAAEWIIKQHRLTLPTEAQWEYACRSGTATPWFIGRKVAELSKAANVADAFFAAHGGATQKVTANVDDGHAVHAPVGSFAPNAFGLHDMHGNVWEWCADAYRHFYAPGPRADPILHADEGRETHILRGGSWLDVAAKARSASRHRLARKVRHESLGFRPAARLSTD